MKYWKYWMMAAPVLIFLSACATSPSGANRPPDMSDLRPLSGTWVGTLTSHEMVSALGMVEAPARLAVTEDGRFTLTTSGNTVVSGVARPTARGLALEGRVTAGDPMAVGREASYLLKPRGANALYGDGEAFYLGHRIDAGLILRRA